MEEEKGTEHYILQLKKTLYYLIHHNVLAFGVRKNVVIIMKKRRKKNINKNTGIFHVDQCVLVHDFSCISYSYKSSKNYIYIC